MFAEALKGRGSDRALIDVRGLGKPPMFKNCENEFVMWARKADDYVSQSSRRRDGCCLGVPRHRR
eukprot:16437217-Heterocapsa_arctica.AAC.2